MPLSSELTRFLADYATAENRAVFARGVDGAPSVANLAAAIRARGYQVDDTDVATMLEAAKQSALEDRELDAVVGGQDSTRNEPTNKTLTDTDAQKLQAINSNLQQDMSKIADIIDRMNQVYNTIARSGT